MKRSQAFPSNFLSKDDVQTPRVFTIKDVRMEEIKGEHGTDNKPIVTFRERDTKEWILNGVNWQTIEAEYGEDSDDWAGKPVELFYDKSVMFGKDRVGGVRCRIPQNGHQAQPSASDPSSLLALAKNAAWSQFQAAFASKPKEQIPGLWRDAIRDYFDGRAHTEITNPIDWQKFAADGFVKMENPIGNVQKFQESEIPF